MPGTIALTGGTGFIGQHLTRRFAAAGWQVRVLTRRPGVVAAAPGLTEVEGALDQPAALHRLVEGAGAVGCAALCEGLIPNTEGRKVVIVISGGNIDMTTLTRILERGLELDGRLARLKVVVPDRPASLAKLANLIAAQHANILQIYQNRHASEVGLGEAELDFTLETRGRSHVSEIIEAMADGGYEVR